MQDIIFQTPKKLRHFFIILTCDGIIVYNLVIFLYIICYWDFLYISWHSDKPAGKGIPIEVAFDLKLIL